VPKANFEYQVKQIVGLDFIRFHNFLMEAILHNTLNFNFPEESESEDLNEESDLQENDE